ncbi:flagellar motor switch protein FliN [Nocardioides sp. SOB77]|uniref:Flagellar motor switch protein FliN n=1 Tax=Nocardioides oceani TaxID=3058369 RepID=A0ABT8FFU8_9ACTN|nr:flagellar motor switch protein FliN [Nocardioides oceani]MDN4173548.1 flagellar motor switch protein FliN [Nocardioides oceani]
MPTGTPRDPDDLVLAAARAAAAVIPASDELEAGGTQPGTPEVTSLFAGAVVADLGGPAGGVLGLLVADDLVSALAASPIGALDLPAAVQPALDAAAAVLGTTVRAARQVDRDAIVAAVLAGSDAGFRVVPLVGDTIAAALLVSVPTLAAHAAGGSPAPVPLPAVGAAATAATAATADAPVPAATSHPLTVPAPGSGGTPGPRRGIEMLNEVDMEVTVELGRTRMTLRDLLALSPGHVLELDRAAGSPADLLVNGHLIARGEVVVIDEDFGLRVTEILETAAAG